MSVDMLEGRKPGCDCETVDSVGRVIGDVSPTCKIHK